LQICQQGLVLVVLLWLKRVGLKVESLDFVIRDFLQDLHPLLLQIDVRTEDILHCTDYKSGLVTGE
jgi:hypothetical protein